MCISWSLYQAPSFIFLPDVAHLGDRNAIFMLRLFDGDDGKRLKALAIQFYITANYNLNKKHIVKLVFVNVWFFMSFALKENIELSFLKSWLFWIGLHLIVQVIKWRLFFFSSPGPTVSSAIQWSDQCVFSVTDYVFFENSSSNPYLIRRIEELNKVKRFLRVFFVFDYSFLCLRVNSQDSSRFLSQPPLCNPACMCAFCDEVSVIWWHVTGVPCSPNCRWSWDTPVGVYV